MRGGEPDWGVHQKRGRDVRRLAITVVMIVLLPVLAYAEERQGPPTARTESEKKRDAAVDKEYQDTIKRMKVHEQPPKTDPWQTVRPPAADNSNNNTRR
jgi:hypothetical protein